jgi:hypothetical protein
MSVRIDNLINEGKTYRDLSKITNNKGVFWKEKGWFIAKPESLNSLSQRLKDAFKIMIGKAFAYHYMEDEIKLPIAEKTNSQERIIASAVKLGNGHIYVGKRHTDAQKNAVSILGEDNFLKARVIDDGFITSELRFIKRKEAFILAKNNGQFKRYELQKSGYDGDELFSEDLW